MRWLIAAAVAALPALGCDEEPFDDCASVCARLADCGILPSPLGSGENARDAAGQCEDQCQRSDSKVHRKFQICVESGGEEPEWCPLELGAPGCRNIENCLRTVLGHDELLGAGSLRIMARMVGSALPAAGAPPCGSDPALSDANPIANPIDFCESLEAESVELFADQAGQRVSVRLSCSSAMAGQTFTELRPGPWVTGMIIRGQPHDAEEDAGMDEEESAGEAPFCWTLYGSTEVVTSRGLSEAEVVLPDPERSRSDAGMPDDWPAGCEDSEIVCSDTLDNDADGDIDCGDSQCAGAARCASPTSPCAPQCSESGCVVPTTCEAFSVSSEDDGGAQ